MDESICNHQNKDKQESIIIDAEEKKTVPEPKVEVKSGESQQLAEAILQVARFSGPIPPPEILARYNEIISNGADRILVMAEQQQAHRHYLEKRVVECDIKRSDRGLIFGFIITLIFGGGGIYLVATGNNVNGLAIIFAPLVSLVGLFIYAQRVRKQERIEKSKNITEQRKSEQARSEYNNSLPKN